MNKYLKNLNKIEFVVTNACTGRCKHCSEGDHELCSERIDPKVAANAVRRVASVYSIKTVMAFGGEPLLHTDAVYAIMNAAKECNVPRRQLITNGYFSKDENQMREVARCLYACGVNDLLLSVDAFHQETIPLDTVKKFAEILREHSIPIRLSPAWLVSAEDENEYNLKTRKILGSFDGMDVTLGDGNVVFPEGNALKYLGEYFTDERPENPYVEDARDVRCLSFLPNGDVLGGNVCREDILEIIRNYTP